MPITEIKALVFSKIKHIKEIRKAVTPLDKSLIVWGDENIIESVPRIQVR
jgi:hypothetical protein